LLDLFSCYGLLVLLSFVFDKVWQKELMGLVGHSPVAGGTAF
jgi:hypothetical protein